MNDGCQSEAVFEPTARARPAQHAWRDFTFERAQHNAEFLRTYIVGADTLGLLFGGFRLLHGFSCMVSESFR